jgi:hypothetical protein
MKIINSRGKLPLETLAHNFERIFSPKLILNLPSKSFDFSTTVMMNCRDLCLVASIYRKRLIQLPQETVSR